MSGSEDDAKVITEQDTSKAQRNKRNLQYIKDRCNGTSKYDDGRRPPCPMCYAPKPILKCPGFAEQNVICETVGKAGCVAHDDAQMRRRLMGIGMIANIIALVLSFLACFSISQNFDMLKAAGFSSGQITIVNTSAGLANLDIGLRAVSFEMLDDQYGPMEQGRHVISFDEFCGLHGSGLEFYQQPGQCDACRSASDGMVSNTIISFITCIPPISTDIRRMYAGYDVNCQKFLGLLTGLISTITMLVACLSYNQSCFASFYDGTISYYMNGTVVRNPPAGVPLGFVDFYWKAGNGLICVYVAIALKLFNIVLLAALPTPTITRDKNEQAQYEALYGGDQCEEVDEKEDNEANNNLDAVK